MKCIILYFAMLGCFSTRAAGFISLSDAVKQKLVTVTIHTLDHSSDSIFHPAFYSQCIVFEIKNLKPVPIEVSEPEGRFLMPDDSLLQRMIITSPVTVTLASLQSKSVPVFAMCTEAHDGSPGISTVFSYGKVAEGNLLRLVQFLAKNHYQDDSGQNAIWCITDGYSPYSIYSADSIQGEQLRKLVCGLRHVPYNSDQDREVVQLPHSAHINGNFQYTIERAHLIDLRVYNEQNQLVKDVVHAQSQQPGTYSYQYDVDVPVNDDRHPPAMIVRFYFDGKMIAEKTHVLRNY